MTGARITATFNDGGLSKGLRRAQAVMHNTTAMMATIAVGMRANTQKRFDHGVDPQGRTWAPLNSAYAATKSSSGGILIGLGMRGGLMGSLSIDASPNTATVGTNKVYGAIHQFGGTIRPRNAKALVFRLGAHFVRVKAVTIPARPYLGFSTADQTTAEDAIDSYVGRALRGS